MVSAVGCTATRWNILGTGGLENKGADKIPAVPLREDTGGVDDRDLDRLCSKLVLSERMDRAGTANAFRRVAKGLGLSGIQTD